MYMYILMFELYVRYFVIGCILLDRPLGPPWALRGPPGDSHQCDHCPKLSWPGLPDRCRIDAEVFDPVVCATEE